MQIPWLFPIFIFSLTFNKIPWLFPDFCQVWNFPDFSLTAGHPAYVKQKWSQTESLTNNALMTVPVSGLMMTLPGGITSSDDATHTASGWLVSTGNGSPVCKGLSPTTTRNKHLNNTEKWSLIVTFHEVSSFVFRIIRLHQNFTGVLVALLPRHQSNFKAI